MTTIEEIVKFQQELLNHQRNQKQHQRETIQLLNSLNKSITFMLDRLDEFAKRTNTKLEDYENADESQKPSSSFSSSLTSNIIPVVSNLKVPLNTSTNNFSTTNPNSTVSFSILPGQNQIEASNGRETSNNNKNFLSNIILVSNNGIQAEPFAATIIPASNVVAKVPIPMLKSNTTTNNNSNNNNNLSKTNKSNQNRLFNRNQKVKEYFANDSKNNSTTSAINPEQATNMFSKLNDNIKQATTGFKLIDLNSSNAVLLGTQNGSTNITNINNNGNKLILDESMNDSYMDESNDSKTDDDEEEEVVDEHGLLNSSSLSNKSNKEKETIQSRKKSRISENGTAGNAKSDLNGSKHKESEESNNQQRLFNKFVRESVERRLGKEFLLFHEIQEIDANVMEEIRREALDTYPPINIRPRRAWHLAKASLRCRRRSLRRQKEKQQPENHTDSAQSSQQQQNENKLRSDSQIDSSISEIIKQIL